MKIWKDAAVFVVLTGSATMVPLMAQSPSFVINKDNRTIAVTATDSASAQADVAVVHIGFQTLGRDEQTTYAEGSRISNAIMAALTGASVPKSAIESENQSLAPLQDFEIKQLTADRAGMRFRLQQSWTVKTSAEDPAKILDIAVKAGANESGSIDWQLADEDALQGQAAAKALEHAQKIASQMAAGLHIRLGSLVYASNEAPQAPQPVPMLARMAAPAPMRKAAPLAITSRKVERSATVYAVFAVE